MKVDDAWASTSLKGDSRAWYKLGKTGKLSPSKPFKTSAKERGDPLSPPMCAAQNELIVLVGSSPAVGGFQVYGRVLRALGAFARVMPIMNLQFTLSLANDEESFVAKYLAGNDSITLEVTKWIPEWLKTQDYRAIAFLARFPSGAIRGLEMYLHALDQRVFLEIPDILSLVDPNAEDSTSEQLYGSLSVVGFRDRAVDEKPGVVGSQMLRFSDGHRLQRQHIDRPLAVLVHGFTSHGRYMKIVADAMAAEGFLPVMFNYDSYLGIKYGSDALQDQMNVLLDNIQECGFVLIGHSMGGLVIRHFALNASGSLRKLMHGIVLLGTPNSGALGGNKFISAMIRAGEKLAGAPLSRGFARGCATATELIGKDKGKIIAGLNQAQNKNRVPVPILSVSGGKKEIRWGKNWLTKAFQPRLRCSANDGLVCEGSANLNSALGGRFRTITHYNKYADYPIINHTNLTQCQFLSGFVAAWLSNIYKAYSPCRQKLDANKVP